MQSSAASPSSQTHDTTPVVPTASLDASKLEEKFAAVNGDFTRGVTIKGKDDAMKLQGKVNDWRDDVSTLATHIAAQLQFCKSLRTSKAMALIPNTTPGDSDSQGEVDIFRLLRSDIRSLYEYRLSYLSNMTDSMHWAGLDKEAARMKEILDAPSTLDKTGGDPTVAFDTLLKFVMAKGDMVSKIADDFVSKKKEVDMNNGIEDELVLDDHSATSMLLSRDTKLFTKLLDTFQLLYKESRKPSNTQTPQSGDDSGGLFASTTTADWEGAKGLRMDEANFTIQKLQREVNDLKIQKAKLVSTNSQLEDNFAHMLAQFELEKRTHQANVQWHEPRIQKLEDEIRTSANALAELRLNVDLITNMYKKTCDDVVAYDKQKSVVADERDILGQKLHDEVKKISILNLELVRKDKLVMYAMGARHEVLKCWNETKAALAEMTTQRDNLAATLQDTQQSVRRLEALLVERDEMCVVLKREVSEKGAAIDTLRGNIVELQTGHEERMLEKTKRHEEEFDKLLVKFDKTKKELVETVQDNIISLTMYILYLFDIWKYVFAIYICICLIYVKYVSLNLLVHILDGKLRAAHDRISRFLS
ncbi:hypothetical protein, variant 1 [Aphanomyces astaci]|uniref:Uncharacterized protein n=1 Tax=Aphanomyces astaci TaxID=112090 RepID=W4FHB6_APHAT|nr:hypothetical protein, variant 1 [Aphanomyces astaci]ETV66133.1 hypothetical protein, variant 1 [Aphanomyces astaci]|eukprot:XP_009844322.1 hypothetical protein, variant 1 [Aphanomyces astaci]